ncbi:MAG TPA: DUF998 domain-containing protein [Caulobacteraceae bacterium]|nr:DUF998 domain-containing protein [Caulobacteraceae bacterium]
MPGRSPGELGAVGDEARPALAVLNLTIALCSLVFAYGLLSFAGQSELTGAPAYLVGFLAIPAVGLAAFPTPHRLHNVFGLLQIVSFIGAPLTAALTWQNQPTVILLSWTELAVQVVALILNLAPAFSPRVREAFAPVYDLIQRLVFVAWYGWYAALGLLLFLRHS